MANGNMEEAPSPRRMAGRRWCLLGMLGGLAGLALPWLTPLWLGFDIFSQFTIQFAIIIAACFIGWLLPRHHLKVALLLVIAGGLCIPAVGFWHAAPAPGHLPAGVIRVMSFNTWTNNHDIPALAAEIGRRQPDFVGLVEFGPPKQRLKRMLAAQYPHAVDCTDIPFCYTGFLSRWPVERVKARSLWRGPPYLHVRVHTPYGPLRVLVVHTLRFPWMRSQLKQMRAMVDIVKRVEKSGEPVIVMGDFNSTPFSLMLRTLQQGIGLKRLTWLPSWPARPLPLPQLAIDHVFVSPSLRLHAGPFTGGAAGSDHLPVIVELAMPHAGAAAEAH